MTLLKVGRLEISYTRIKPKEYIAPAVINSAMGLMLNPQGKVSKGTINVMLMIFGYKFIVLAKSKDIGKLLDLTIKYGITVICFYILPYAVHSITHGSLSVVDVKQMASILCNAETLLSEG